MIFNMLGIALIIGAIALWIGGALKSDIHDNIDNDQLITSGAYAYVRNPIYSAFLFLATGMIVFYGNIILFLLPILYWALLTELMKRTEEKWLEEKFGDEYRKYCKEVNRCIPWFK
ncbi:methyltransferase family protein [Methanobrevibacter sp.]|uniref:methyltransferase family protein n=1 Tax=Methanobrevibacter sp. TaxID=66852 RepID=UPI002E78F106|nr:isoprenylcysteine carboxylmethyltransferase family protein [Methanobrevibacter sp.]